MSAGPPREERPGSRRVDPASAVAIGLGVLAAWLALFYAGLAWFRRMAGR